MKKLLYSIIFLFFNYLLYSENLEVISKQIGLDSNFEKSAILFIRNSHDFSQVWHIHSPNFKIKKVDFKKYDYIFIFSGKSKKNRKFRFLSFEKDRYGYYINILCDKKFIDTILGKIEKIDLDKLYNEKMDIKYLKEHKDNKNTLLINDTIEKKLAEKSIDLVDYIKKNRKKENFYYIILKVNKIDGNLYVNGYENIYDEKYINLKYYKKNYKKLTFLEISKYLDINSYDKNYDVFCNTEEFTYIYTDDLIDNKVLEAQKKRLEQKKRVLEKIKKAKLEQTKNIDETKLSDYERYKLMLQTGRLDEYFEKYSKEVNKK